MKCGEYCNTVVFLHGYHYNHNNSGFPKLKGKGRVKVKERIKQILLKNGADVCGVANIDRFGEAPRGFSPRDLFLQCRSVITFGIALPKGLIAVEPRLIYGHYNGFSCNVADEVSFRTAKMLEKVYNCLAVPLPSDSPYEYWDSDASRGRGLISMKHAAVLSGIGTLGKNSMLLNPDYGNMLTIGAILTDLDLPSDNLCEDICISGCSKCVRACPVHAIADGRVNQKLCRANTYGKTARGFDTVDCNKCRAVCPMKYGKVK